MKNILLVYPPCLEANMRPPLGLAYLASYLRDKISNIEIRILDLTLYREWEDRFIEELDIFNPEIIGFSVPTVGYENTKHLLSIIRRRNFVKMVVLGGPHPSAMPKSILEENPDIVIVKGEGEQTLGELIEGKNMHDIAGIVYINDSKVIETKNRPFIQDLDSIPHPARDLLQMDKYKENFEGFPVTTIMSSRGCPFHCIYCCKATLGTRWVGRSAENVVDEIIQIQYQFGIRIIMFHDDLFSFDKDRVIKMCHLLKEKNIDIKWLCVTRVDLISKQLLETMHAAGCVSINFGVETGNVDIMHSIKKGITHEQAINAVRWCRQLGIDTAANFMIGLPEDTESTIADTIKFAKQLNADRTQFTLTTPHPDTELWDILFREGRISLPIEWGFFRVISLSKYKNMKPYFVHKHLSFEKLVEYTILAEKEWKRHMLFREVKKLNFRWLIKKTIEVVIRRFTARKYDVSSSNVKTVKK